MPTSKEQVTRKFAGNEDENAANNCRLLKYNEVLKRDPNTEFTLNRIARLKVCENLIPAHPAYSTTLSGT